MTYVFHIEIKNNTGLSTKFKGTQEQFNSQYIDIDHSMGKVIDYTREKYYKKVDNPMIVNDIYSMYYGQSIHAEETDIYLRKIANRRYKKYI